VNIFWKSIVWNDFEANWHKWFTGQGHKTNFVGQEVKDQGHIRGQRWIWRPGDGIILGPLWSSSLSSCICIGVASWGHRTRARASWSFLVYINVAISPVDSGRLVVKTTHFQFQPQINRRLSINFCDFCLISWTRTPCPPPPGSKPAQRHWVTYLLYHELLLDGLQLHLHKFLWFSVHVGTDRWTPSNRYNW